MVYNKIDAIRFRYYMDCSLSDKIVSNLSSDVLIQKLITNIKKE